MKNKFGLFAALVIVSLILGACGPSGNAVAVPFSDLVKNKAGYERYPQGCFACSYSFTNGVVVYVNADKGFYVATGNPVPTKVGKLSDDQYILVRDRLPDGAGVGSIVTAVGGIVNEKTGQDNNGNPVTVLYLETVRTEVTGRVDVSDPDFEQLVKVVDDQIRRDNTTLFIVIWLFYFSPMSPMSPFYSGNH